METKPTPKYGRFLTDYEQEAHDNFERVLDEYHKVYRVRAYERVSVINAFPEIKEAWEKCMAAHTFYKLSK